MVDRFSMGLRFETSRMGGNRWAGNPDLKTIAGLLATGTKSAYTGVLSHCMTMASLLGYGDVFMIGLKKQLRFIYRGDEATKGADLLAAFEKVSQAYMSERAAGAEDDRMLNGHVLSGLLENLTDCLLRREGDRTDVVADVVAFDGPNRIPVRNSTNLDFAASTPIGRDVYWELFECKQAPSQFFEPLQWSNDPDPNRKQRWMGSQIRLALAILDVGQKFASVAVVCYTGHSGDSQTHGRWPHLGHASCGGGSIGSPSHSGSLKWWCACTKSWIVK